MRFDMYTPLKDRPKPSANVYVGLPSNKQLLARLGRKEDNSDDIINITCDTLNITREQLVSHSRERHLVEARMICVGLILQVSNMPLKKIGVLLGGKHHSSIIHLRKTYDDLYNRDKEFTIKVNKVLQLT